MNHKLIPLINTIELNSKLLKNCFEGVDHKTAEKRIDDKTNSMIFILIHLIDSRYFFLNFLGVEEKSPYYELTKDINSIEGFNEYPPLNEMLEVWEKSKIKLINKLYETTDEEINTTSKVKFPIKDDTILGTITFGVQHESFHIGQLSLLRKHLGFPAMSYN